MTSHGQDSGEFGGMGGETFDDVTYSVGARPISITVRSGDFLDALQITYGNTYLAPLCIDCDSKLTEFNILKIRYILFISDISRPIKWVKVDV